MQCPNTTRSIANTFKYETNNTLFPTILYTNYIQHICSPEKNQYKDRILFYLILNNSLMNQNLRMFIIVTPINRISHIPTNTGTSKEICSK